MASDSICATLENALKDVKDSQVCEIYIRSKTELQRQPVREILRQRLRLRLRLRLRERERERERERKVTFKNVPYL